MSDTTVTIDYEDREQVERLADAVVHARMGNTLGNAYPGETTNLQAALRSLVSPPRPDEPTGLGAVVEDEDGRLWVRTFTDGRCAGWRTADFAGRYRQWESVAAVKVLSVGVTL